MKLDIRLEDDAVAPGGELTGSILVLEGGRSRSLTLTVSFCERSPSFLSVAFESSNVVYEGDLATGQAVTFRYEVPASAPPSVKGRHGELFWQLEAVSNEPGLDTRATRLFTVAGTGR